MELFKIVINLIQFSENFKNNINDVIEFFVCGEFPPFCEHIKGLSTSTKDFLIK